MHLEETTKNQSYSAPWFAARKFRLTASYFGEICKMTEARDLQSLCSTLYSSRPLRTEAIQYGKIHEKSAIRKFQDTHHKEVTPCGLFVDPQVPFLGASPDGCTDGGESLIEMKCPFRAKDSMIVPGKNIPFLVRDDTGKFVLKKNHNYSYQVQGQLGIAKKKKCYFVVFTLKDLFVQEVYFDQAFYAQEMLPKLKKFYEQSYRPYVASKL